MSRPARRAFVLLLLLALAGTPTRAQLPADACWRDGLHPAGLQGFLFAMRPFQGGLVVGGSLTAIGERPVANVARFELVDGRLAGGAPLGDGLDGRVLALGEHEGDLVAGGEFTHSGAAPRACIARWDGASWQPIGAGLPGVAVKALASYGGQLYAGAYRWDGQAWANGLETNGDVRFLAVHDGRLYVGGSFTTAAGVPVNNAFAWDGTTVQPLGSGLSGPVVGLAVVDGAVAFAAAPASGPAQVALWENGAWNVIFSGANVESIAAWGDQLAVSYWWRVASYFYLPYLRTWQDGAWTTRGSLTSRLMIEQAGELLLAADTAAVSGIVSPGLIAHDGAGFRAAFAPGDGCDDGFNALVPLGDNAIAAGSFRIAGGGAIDRVAVAAEDGWYPWGYGADLGPDGWFADLAMVGGQTFGIHSRFAVDYIESELCRLVWQNGQAEWQSLPSFDHWQATGLVPTGAELHALDGGTLVKVSLPDGGRLPLPGLDPDGFLLTACLHEGALVTAGQLEANGGAPCGHVLRRDGATWTDLGNPPGATQVTALATLGDAGLAAAYRPDWGPVRRVALFDGAGWQPLGGEFDDDVTNLASHRGFLFAAGDFDHVGGTAAHGLAMWTGATWLPVGSGVTGSTFGRVTDLVSAGRNLWLCGSFVSAGGRPSAGLACWSGDPAALASTSAVPATRAGGNVLLRAPWPNPFNPRTELAFTLPFAGQARLRIHDARGALVRALVDGPLTAGEHRRTWDGLDQAGRPAPSGAYFARLEAGSTVESAKLVLVR